MYLIIVFISLNVFFASSLMTLISNQELKKNQPWSHVSSKILTTNHHCSNQIFLSYYHTWKQLELIWTLVTTSEGLFWSYCRITFWLTCRTTCIHYHANVIFGNSFFLCVFITYPATHLFNLWKPDKVWPILCLRIQVWLLTQYK